MLAEIQSAMGEWTKDWEIVCSQQSRKVILGWLRDLGTAVAEPAECGPAPSAVGTDKGAQESGRPAVGGFGEVGMPAQNAGGMPAQKTVASQSHREAADGRAHRRAS
jgi:hypothetical protein